jgi:exodeoxyribonuclease VII small subunit
MKEISFEKKIEKSKTILEKLMNPEITLSDSVALYKEGILELKEAGKLLEDAKLEFLEYQESDKKEEKN